MKVMIPCEITSSRIISTSLPERLASEPELYDPLRAYAADEQCVVPDTDRIYQSLVDNNQGHFPPDNPEVWASTGATNRGRWNDEYISTFSEDLEALGYIQIEVDATSTTSIALFGVRGTSVQFWLLDPVGAVVAERTIDMLQDDCLDWYDHAFATPEYGNRVYWQYPFTAAGTLRFRVNLPGGGARLGIARYGLERVLGQTLFPIKPGMLDFSEKVTDSLGRTRIKQGLYADLLDFTVVIQDDTVDKVRRVLERIRGLPVVWLADNLTDSQDTLDGSYETLMVCGYYSSLSGTISWSKEYMLSVEGVV